VPVVTHAEARSRSIALGLTAPSSGTTLEIRIARIDPDDSRLLGGAHRWTQSGVTVRQQLGLLSWPGTSTELLFAIEDSRGETNPEEPSDLAAQGVGIDPVRRALLDQRRITGGLALSF
jgi:hypothetical protein